jgi:hypothetical protein
MIFAARSEPKAIVLIDTEAISKICLMKREEANALRRVQSKESHWPLVFELWSLIKGLANGRTKDQRPKTKGQKPLA